MNILVCGGAGFIGSNFVHHILDEYDDYNIVVYDKLTYAGNPRNHESVAEDDRFAFEEGCIRDLDKLIEVIEDHNIDRVINFAAETHVDRSIHGACKEFVLTNTLGPQMILEAVEEHNLDKFVNVSTDEVYGSLALDSEEEFTEETSIKPNMPYAAAKAGGDLMCRSYYQTHETPVVVTHCSNNYGPYQFPEKIIPFFVFKLLEDENVPVYGDGKNVRDWIHVKDHVNALDLLLHDGEPGEVYNIGADNERSNLELTKMILDIMGKSEDKIEFVEDRPGHDRRYAIDETKIKELGWQPDYTRDKFKKGLKETIEWYLNNKEWVNYIQNRKEDEMNTFQEELDRSEEKMETDSTINVN
jgi:dTDP-glucose 4,6-dehydratase